MEIKVVIQCNCILADLSVTTLYLEVSPISFVQAFDFVFVYWHLILVTPDGPRFRSTFLPRLPLAMVVLF